MWPTPDAAQRLDEIEERANANLQQINDVLAAVRECRDNHRADEVNNHFDFLVRARDFAEAADKRGTWERCVGSLEHTDGGGPAVGGA